MINSNAEMNRKWVDRYWKFVPFTACYECPVMKDAGQEWYEHYARYKELTR